MNKSREELIRETVEKYLTERDENGRLRKDNDVNFQQRYRQFMKQQADYAQYDSED